MASTTVRMKTGVRRLVTSWCVATGTTRWAVRLMGGLDPDLIARQLEGINSFSDEAWCGYWNAIADQHEDTATRLLDEWDEPGEGAWTVNGVQHFSPWRRQPDFCGRRPATQLRLRVALYRGCDSSGTSVNGPWRAEPGPTGTI